MASVDEYNTLREELLALAEQADGAWRSGLVGIAAVTAAILLQRELAQTVLCTEWSKFVALLVLCGVATLMAFLESLEALRFERGANRIGGYLAAFHDDSGLQHQDTTNIGWHAWNRVEKEVKKDEKLAKKVGEIRVDTERPTAQVTSVGKRCGIFLPVLFFFWLLMFVFVDAWNPSSIWFWGSISIVVIKLFVCSICLWLATRRAEREAVEQTKRWYQIVQLPPEEVKKYLERWGRPRADAVQP